MFYDDTRPKKYQMTLKNMYLLYTKIKENRKIYIYFFLFVYYSIN